MRINSFILLLCLILTITSAYAKDCGPTISSVTDSILTINQENGRWYPKGDWWMLGISSGQELKTQISDSQGKTVGWATWNFTPNKQNDELGSWAFVGNWETASFKRGDASTNPKLNPGDYTLSILVDNKVVWKTPFEVTNTRFQQKDNYNITGFWKNLAYFYLNKRKDGILAFWLEGPQDLSWYNPVNFENAFALKGEIKKDGNTIAFTREDRDNWLGIYPGKVTRKAKEVFLSVEASKILANDGDYEVIVYAGKGENWTPVAHLTVPIKNGKIQKNQELSENTAKLAKILSSTAYYGKNKATGKLPAHR